MESSDPSVANKIFPGKTPISASWSRPHPQPPSIPFGLARQTGGRKNCYGV
jgi:hypothetical protein